MLKPSIRLEGGGEWNRRILKEVNNPTNHSRLQIGCIISASPSCTLPKLQQMVSSDFQMQKSYGYLSEVVAKLWCAELDKLTLQRCNVLDKKFITAKSPLFTRMMVFTLHRDIEKTELTPGCDLHPPRHPFEELFCGRSHPRVLQWTETWTPNG